MQRKYQYDKIEAKTLYYFHDRQSFVFLRILGVLKYLGLLFELYTICYYVKHVFALHSPPTIT